MTTTHKIASGILALALLAGCNESDTESPFTAGQAVGPRDPDTPAAVAEYHIENSDGRNERHLDDYITVDGDTVIIDTRSESGTGTFYQLDGEEVLEEILEAGGFRSSTLTKIGRTRSLDGTQDDEGDGYEASWTYHPDNGLNLIIEPTT